MHSCKVFVVCLVAVLMGAVTIPTWADKGSYTLAGGSFRAGTAVGQVIAVSNVPLSASHATLSFSCPIATTNAGTYQVRWTCAGGSIVIASTDNSLVFHGAFVAATMILSISAGGKGSTSSYTYQFDGEVRGTVSAGGVTQAVYGAVEHVVQASAALGTKSAAISSGKFGWSSAYRPVLVADNGKRRILGADSILGANLAGFGTAGTGTGQFGTIAGITEDAVGRIYATDSVLNRVVRIDDLTGANWMELGGTGTGNDHFMAPAGVAVDAGGKIWVVDSGNNRVVRFDDMSGRNWVSFGAVGSGKNQFRAPTGIALDALGRVYVADTNNNRVVRFDDVTGKNWTALSAVTSGAYGYALDAPQSIALNAAGQIYIALGGLRGYLIRVDTMTGANPSLSAWTNPLTSISADRAGSLYVTGQFPIGMAEVTDALETGYFASPLGGAVATPGPVYSKPVAGHPPADAVSLTPAIYFGNQTVGKSSATRTFVLTNLGAAVLTLHSITASSDYVVSHNCPSQLAGGSACLVNVVFRPTVAGRRAATLVVASNGVHPAVGVSLNGVAIAAAKP